MNETNATTCAQCKHFYVRVDVPDGLNTKLGDVLYENGDWNDEIRLCYEIHWCNAASPVCDGDFEPLDDVDERDDADEKLKQHADHLFRKSIHRSMDFAKNWLIHGSESIVPKPQKEIQYVYIGLLQLSSIEDSDWPNRLKEVPTEIDGAATNYRRVEMGPMDWGFCNSNNPAAIDFLNPDTAVNGVDIDFPVAQTDWYGLSHFGMYDLPVGGRLICISEFMACMDIIAGNCATIDVCVAEIPLEYLLANDKDEKKGGE